MNKKFSTLAASMLLATAVGTVSAQSASGDAPYFSKSEAPALNTVATVTDGRAYQLSNGHHVLVMKKIPDGKAGFYYRLAFVPFGEANLGESLWIIETDDENSSSVNGPAFRFRNLAHNYCISYDIAKVQQYDGPWEPTNLGGKAVAWSWMRSTSGGDLTIGRTPEAYFDKDSVMTLIPLYDKGGEVAAVKYAAKDVKNKVSQLQIRPYEAGPVWLNKFDLNTLLQTQEEDKQVMFHFAKGTSTENLWDQKPYTAVDAKGKNTLSYGAVADAKQEAEDAYKTWEEKLLAWGTALEKLAASDQEVAAIYERLRAKNKELSDKKIEIGSKKNDLNAAWYQEGQLKDRIESYREAIINASNLADHEKTTMKNYADQIANLDVDYDNKNAEITKLQEDISGYSEEITTLRGEITEAERGLKNWESVPVELGAMRDVLLASQGRVEDWKDVVAYAKEQGTNISDFTIEWFAEALDAGRIDVNESDKLLQNETIKNWFDKAIGVANSTIEGYDSIVTTNNDVIVELEGKIATANADIEQKRNTLETIKQQREEKERLWAEAQKRAEESSKEAAKYVVLIVLANQELEDLQEQITTLNSEYEALMAEKEGILTDMKNIDKELNAADEANFILEWEAIQAEKAAKAADCTWQGLFAVWKHLDAFKTPHWLSLMTADNKYLMVDTAYVNNNEEVAGINHLRFNVAAHDEDFVNVNAPLSARDINGRFNFRFLYFPTQDSLRIEADGFNQKDVTTKYWKNRSDNEIRLHSSIVPGRENNLVKVAVLGGHREVTVGSAERVKVSNNFLYTINDRIGLKITPASDPITLDPGLYYMDLVNSSNSHENGARLMADLDGTLTKIAPAAQGKMEFAHMPAAKWYVEEKPSDFGGYPGIFNLETEAPLNNFAYKVEQRNDSSFVSISYNYQGQTNVVGDFVLTKAPESEEGYYRADTKDPRDIYTLNYLNITPGLNVEVGSETVGNDSVLVVANSDGTKFKLHRTAVEKYGMGKKLSRGIYKLSVNDPDKLTMNNRYVKITTVDGTEQVVVVTDAKTATEFYLKEINHDPETDMHYYALIDKAVDKKLGVVGATGLIEAEDITAESETSAFALLADTTRYYREFTAEELGENNVMKFYRVNSNKEYLYFGENNLLEVEGKEDNAGDLANMTVVPTTEPGVLMPQYLIVRNAEMKKGEIIPCGEEHATEEEMLACQHTTIVDDSLKGLFLVNTRVDEELYKSTLWENKYTRLAFVEGHSVKSVVDSTSTFDWIALETGDTIQLAGNKHNPAKFEFRLINENEEQDFLIESESWKGEDAFGGEARPLGEKKGGWLKIQNGVPVIVSEEFEAAVQSDIYNVETSEIDDPTANDEISTSEVTVIAGNGQITINGAAGKKVVVSNILGQVVANTVLTSDNATIAAPQGVVVVAVEGEEAVKAIVK